MALRIWQTFAAVVGDSLAASSVGQLKHASRLLLTHVNSARRVMLLVCLI